MEEGRKTLDGEDHANRSDMDLLSFHLVKDTDEHFLTPPVTVTSTPHFHAR